MVNSGKLSSPLIRLQVNSLLVRGGCVSVGMGRTNAEPYRTVRTTGRGRWSSGGVPESGIGVHNRSVASNLPAELLCAVQIDSAFQVSGKLMLVSSQNHLQ